jgi:hypothetical protein
MHASAVCREKYSRHAIFSSRWAGLLVGGSIAVAEVWVGCCGYVGSVRADVGYGLPALESVRLVTIIPRPPSLSIEWAPSCVSCISASYGLRLDSYGLAGCHCESGGKSGVQLGVCVPLLGRRRSLERWLEWRHGWEVPILSFMVSCIVSNLLAILSTTLDRRAVI